jgi:hypothetical protein
VETRRDSPTLDLEEAQKRRTGFITLKMSKLEKLPQATIDEMVKLARGGKKRHFHKMDANNAALVNSYSPYSNFRVACRFVKLVCAASLNEKV